VLFRSQAETLVICHHGIRSLQMCQWLQSQGFTNVKNINGGIDAYSLLVDSNIPRY
jgi:rhodanese-related sulfurtransferase